MDDTPLYQDASAPIDQRVDDLLVRMSLAEKVGQLHQIFSGRELPLSDSFDELIRHGNLSSFIWPQRLPAERNRLQRIAVEETRLGIPLIFGMDIIHGARTVFPIAPAMACSFEPELFERAQSVAAREARAEGLEWVFAPMCDLARDARWGRVAETCGEDPYLSARCNAAQVRGFQGDDPSAPDRVAACLKHFVGYSTPRGGRDYSATEITEWTLRNAHLPPFQAGIEAGVLTVMSSFQATGGIPAVANRHTLTEVLRNEWGFSGFVVSDWNAVAETIPWGLAADEADATRLTLTAGNDMDMLSGSYLATLAEQVENGALPLDVVDEAVRRVLRIKFHVGLFERPYVDEAAAQATSPRAEDLALARECVHKSAVLLKNEDLLPLNKELRKVALIGPFADDRTEMIGCWGGERYELDEVVTMEAGLRTRFGAEVDLAVVKGCAISTQPRLRALQDGTTVIDEDAEPPTDELELAEAVQAAEAADVVIMAVGEPKGWTGEGGSRGALGLAGRQQELFDAVAAVGKPIVTIVFSGRSLALPSVVRDSAAVLYAWQPGLQAGHGLADLLSGDVSPSARLSMSVPYDVGQVPLYYNHYATGRPGQGRYRDEMPTAAQFWFGYGLTYTTFAYSDLEIVPATDSKPALAVATITNTGDRAGTETVQLYVRQLACHQGARPMQELRGFQRLTLAGGASAEVSFELTDQVLGYIDRAGQASVDPGTYHLWIAPHARTGEPLVYHHQH